MPNQFNQAKIYANAALKILKNNLVAARMVSSETIDKAISSERGGAATGGTVYVKRPPEFIVRQGRVAQVQDSIIGEVAVSIDKQRGVDLEFTSLEETLSVDEFMRDENANSAMAQLAQQIEQDVCEITLEFPGWVGTPGQLIDSGPDFFRMPERMDELAIPQNDRVALMSPADKWAFAGGLTNNAAQANELARTALENGRIPNIGMIDTYMTQNVPTLTCGTRTNGAVNGASQAVAFTSVRNDYKQNLVIDGVGANATIRRGEVFTIANVFAVNPRSKATLPFLAQFVVLADATANGAGEVTVSIANPIITSGAYQNVNSAPADNAVITWTGAASTAFRQNISFHKSAIKLVSARLIKPSSGECAFARDPETGLTIRYWKTSDGTNDTHLHRWDVIYGVVNTDRRLGVRGSGTA